MKARLEGIVKSMTRDNVWVHITAEVTGSVVEGARGMDAKSAGAEITLRLKPVVGDELKFGQKLYFTVSTTDVSHLLKRDSEDDEDNSCSVKD